MRGITTDTIDTAASADGRESSAERSATSRPSGRRLRPVAALVAIAVVLVFGFTAVYVTAFHSPRPHGVKIAMVGSQSAVTQADHAIDRGAPGSFTFERYASETAARTALRDADVHGALVLGPRHNTTLVAGAFGFAPAQAITTAAQQLSRTRGASLTIQDVNPLPPHDSRGLASFFTVFGTLVPSIVFGALLTLTGGRLPIRVRWPALILFALCAGAVAALSVDTVVGALRGHFWAVAGVAGLLAFAVASAVHGLGRVAGIAGVAGTALVLVLLGQSSSGGALTYQLEPSFYGAISQLLPNGAAITAMRNSVYFHGAHTLFPLIVLSAWATVAALLGLTGDAIRNILPTLRELIPVYRAMRRRTTATAGPTSAAV